MTGSALKRTPLYDRHVALGARMTEFAGYDMPVQYSGIVDEHMAVRETAGLFDVSHMGEVFVQGPHTFAFVQNLVTNDVSRLHDGRALYTVMCRPDGGIIDDLLVYRLREDAYMLVINASNIEKDFAWMCAHNPMGASLHNTSEYIALLALQGPQSPNIAQRITDYNLSDIKYYHFLRPAPGSFLGCNKVILSRTGYTGEKGLELYVETENAEKVWDALMEAEPRLKPCGLGARDTLRLEAGFCLYGNELSEDTNPYEAGLGWLTKPDKGEFIGRDALRTLRDTEVRRKLVGFVLEGRGIPRPGYQIVDDCGQVIGNVTSGSQSPVLKKGIGLGYVQSDKTYAAPGAAIAVQIRTRTVPARVVKPPFHRP